MDIRIYAERIELWYGQQLIETLPRLRGENQHRINYRHVIDWLVRKPGAFENYRYLQDLFPTHRFRMAYDALKAANPQKGHKDYLKLLHLAARENELLVEAALHGLIETGSVITFEAVKNLMDIEKAIPGVKDVHISEVALQDYDSLLTEGCVS